MKPIKKPGLAVLTALMAMAFVGASSAMATEPTALCNIDPGTGLHEVCPSGHLVSHVHATTLSGAKAIFLNKVSNILCDVLTLGDVITAGLLGKNTLEILGNFTYTNCVDEKPNPCTVKEISKHAIIEVLKEAHELGSVTLEHEIETVCNSIVCKYSGIGIKAHAVGPLLSSETNGVESINGQALKKIGGLLCPETLTLDLTLTSLEAIYITE